MLWLIFLLALASGVANPFQAGANAELNKQLGQPVWAGIAVYASGLAGLLLLQFVFRQPLPSLARSLSAHPWAWFGGLISIGSTMAGLLFAQRLGSGVFTGLSITASVLTSVALDQFGLLGFRQHAAGPARLVGCTLLIAGCWMVSRF